MDCLLHLYSTEFKYIFFAVMFVFLFFCTLHEPVLFTVYTVDMSACLLLDNTVVVKSINMHFSAKRTARYTNYHGVYL